MGTEPELTWHEASFGSTFQAAINPHDGLSPDRIVWIAAPRPQMSALPEGQAGLRWLVESRLLAVRTSCFYRQFHLIKASEQGVTLQEFWNARD